MYKLYISLAASTHLWQHVLTCRMCSILSINSLLDQYDKHVHITGSKYSPLAACPHLQNVHSRHVFTTGPCTMSMYLSLAANSHLFGSMSSPAECASSAYIHCWIMYGELVLITSSKYTPLAACPHPQNVHPPHIFTAGPCMGSLYLSLAASTHFWQHVLSCRMCILGIFSLLDHVR
jgi:hypothetical protein